uniref:Secreted protein n=1 Tax=Panagrellus redivivus TaxID=6233 RepID=A0A7E4ZXY8_PANRE
MGGFVVPGVAVVAVDIAIGSRRRGKTVIFCMISSPVVKTQPPPRNRKAFGMNPLAIGVECFGGMGAMMAPASYS